MGSWARCGCAVTEHCAARVAGGEQLLVLTREAAHQRLPGRRGVLGACRMLRQQQGHMHERLVIIKPRLGPCTHPKPSGQPADEVHIAQQ
jgi:hypothetical protein